jgi:hypothetical protein
MGRKKGVDEIFCRSCGEIIKKKAEVCPECGVRNHKQKNSPILSSTQSTQQQQQQPQQTTVEKPHDPNKITTTVSEKWYYGVSAAIGVGLLGMAVPEEFGGGFFLLVAWVLMPVSVYYDLQYIRATTNWDPETALWVGMTAFPVLNIFPGAFYLFRRVNMEKVSRPDSTSYTASGDRHSHATTPDSEDKIIVKLREQYATGKLSDEEFERRLEKVVETEDPEVVKQNIRKD